MNYLKCKEKSGNGIYADYIYQINGNNRRKNKKKDFKDSLTDYFIDKKTGRLKIKFNQTNVKINNTRNILSHIKLRKISL